MRCAAERLSGEASSTRCLFQRHILHAQMKKQRGSRRLKIRQGLAYAHLGFGEPRLRVDEFCYGSHIGRVWTSRVSPRSDAFCRSAAERSSRSRMDALRRRSNSMQARMSGRERIHSRTASAMSARTGAKVMTYSVEPLQLVRTRS